MWASLLYLPRPSIYKPYPNLRIQGGSWYSYVELIKHTLLKTGSSTKTQDKQPKQCSIRTGHRVRQHRHCGGFFEFLNTALLDGNAGDAAAGVCRRAPDGGAVEAEGKVDETFTSAAYQEHRKRHETNMANHSPATKQLWGCLAGPRMSLSWAEGDAVMADAEWYTETSSQHITMCQTQSPTGCQLSG